MITKWYMLPGLRCRCQNRQRVRKCGLHFFSLRSASCPHGLLIRRKDHFSRGGYTVFFFPSLRSPLASAPPDASVSFPTDPKDQPPLLRQLRPISQRRGQNLPLVRRRTPFSAGAAKVLRMGSRDDRGFKHCDGRPHLDGRAPPHRMNRWSRTAYEPDRGLLVDPSLLTVSRSRLCSE